MKFHRQKLGWSQQKAANIIGINRASIGAYEEGRSYPALPVFAKICKAYNIPDPIRFIDSPIDQTEPAKSVFEEKLLSLDSRTQQAVLLLMGMN